MISATVNECADLALALDDLSFVGLVSVVVGRIVDERGEEFARAFLEKAIEAAASSLKVIDAAIEEAAADLDKQKQ